MISLFEPPPTERARRGTAPTPLSADALAVHPQGARRPERRLLVGLAAAAGGPCVVRVAAAPEADPHLLALWAHYDALDGATDAVGTPARALFEDAAGRPVLAEAFVEGPSVEAAASRALERCDVAEAARILAGYRDLLARMAAAGDGSRRAAFAAALGTEAAALPAETGGWLPGCALDLLPQNLLRTADGLCAIDLEWSCPAALPLAFLTARALLVLARREGGLLASNWREAGVPLVDLGAGERLPAAIVRALAGDVDRLGVWMPLVRRYEGALQRQAAWQAPWAAASDVGSAPAPVPPSRPYPLELSGWPVLRDRIRRDQEELARLERENARLRRDLAFTTVGLVRRAVDRFPWFGQPLRAAYRALGAARGRASR